MTIEPCSGFNSPISDLRNTDLPVPDGPSNTLTSPGGNVRVTSDQMFARPKDLVSPSTLTSTPTDVLPHWLVGHRQRDAPGNGRPTAHNRPTTSGEAGYSTVRRQPHIAPNGRFYRGRPQVNGRRNSPDPH